MAIVRHPEPPPDQAGQRDRELRGNADRFQSAGSVLLLIGGIGAILGALVYVLGTATASWVKAVGVMLASIAAAPTVGGIVLLAMAATGAWAGRRKPFA